MAQTMPNTLFGPVFIDPAQSITDFVIRYSKDLVSIKKKQKKRKKSSPRAQKTRLTSFGPVSIVPA